MGEGRGEGVINNLYMRILPVKVLMLFNKRAAQKDASNIQLSLTINKERTLAMAGSISSTFISALRSCILIKCGEAYRYG